jgi:hypothetical protein
MSINLAYKAMDQANCLSVGEDCMFLAGSIYKCMQAGESVEDCPLNQGRGCGYSSDGFRSSLSSIMCYHFPFDSEESVPWLSYGLWNQKFLCDAIDEQLGTSPVGVCSDCHFSGG